MSVEPARLSSVVLPVYNQGDHIEGVVLSYVEALAALPMPFEVVLVTNACIDDSAAVCSRLAESMHVVSHVDLEEGGWGRAVKAGLAAAKGDVLCFTNSARTTPEFLVVMLLYAGVYPEVVLKANRRVRDNWIRRLGSLLYNLECRALFDLSVWDINGTPKVFPRTFERLLELRRNDDLIDVEFNVVCRRASYPVVEIPILATVRHGGRATTNLRSAARLYWGALRLRRELGPEARPAG